MLPPSWSEVEVADLIDGFESGRNLKAHGRPAHANEYGVLKVSAVTWGAFRPQENKALYAKDKPKEREIVRQGDLLISRANTTDLVGAPVLVGDDHPHLMLPDKILRLRYREKLVDAQYLVHALRTKPVREYFEREATGTSDSMRNLSQPKIGAARISLAPLNEQRRIVAKIEALTTRSRRAREALDAIPPLLEKLRQSILAAAFRGDLTADWRSQNPDVEPASELLERIRTERRRRWEEAELAKMKAKGKTPEDDRWKAKYKEPEPVDTEGLPELPEGWVWARWEDVGFCQNGRAFPSNEYSDTGVKLLRPGNLHVSGELEWTEKNTRCIAENWAARYPDFVVGPDELVMNLTAQSLKDEFLGRVCLTAAGERCLLNQRLARLSPIVLNHRYCLFWMKSPQFREFVDSLNTGSLIQHMFTSQVDEHVLPVPPLEEQHAIVDSIATQLSHRGSLLETLSTTHEAAQGIDAAVLAKAFRGELVPQDPNDEPASALLDRLREAAASSETRLKRPHPRGRRSRTSA